MKKTIFTIFSSFVLLIFVQQAFAQVPQGFNYQAVARNSSGTLIQNSALGLRLTVHQGSASGTVVYSERQTPTTNQFGLFTVTVGQGTLLSGAFNTIAWSSGNYWLQAELDVNGGTSYTDMGTSQLLTVPYAMFAASSTSPLPAGTSGQTLRYNGTKWVASSLLYNDSTKIGIGTTTPTYKLDVVHGGGTGLHVKSSSSYSVIDIDAANGDAALRFQNAGNNQWNFRNNPTTNDLEIFELGGGGQRMIIQNTTGKLGLGTSAPVGLFSSQTTYKYAGYFTTDSLSSASYAVYAKHTAVGNFDTRAFRGDAKSADGWGYGGDFHGGFIGAMAVGDGGAYSSTAYGIYGNATGTAGTRYGVYGTATGGATNFGVYCSGNGQYTGTWTQLSDSKFKMDVNDYKGALDKVLQLRPVTYSLKTEEFPMMNFPSGKQFGFIAQEMETVFPTLVENGVHPGATKEDKDIEYKSVNYIGLIPVLVNAIQEQQEIIKKQQQQIDELTNLVKSKN